MLCPWGARTRVPGLNRNSGAAEMSLWRRGPVCWVFPDSAAIGRVNESTKTGAFLFL